MMRFLLLGHFGRRRLFFLEADVLPLLLRPQAVVRRWLHIAVRGHVLLRCV